jgi:fumarylacetoacetase
MSATLDDSHDPALRSWVESANDPANEFPIQNLPFGRFRKSGAGGSSTSLPPGSSTPTT